MPVHGQPVTFATRGAAMRAMAGWPSTPGCPHPSSGAPMRSTRCTFRPSAVALAAAAATHGAKSAELGPHAAKMGMRGDAPWRATLRSSERYAAAKTAGGDCPPSLVPT